MGWKWKGYTADAELVQRIEVVSSAWNNINSRMGEDVTVRIIA